MQLVSAAFKAAAVAQDITVVRQVQIALLDNTSIAATITPTAAELDSADFPKTKAINGITANDKKWAFADSFDEAHGGRVLPDGTWYPHAPAYEGGWIGTTQADTNGNIGGGGETFVLSYSTPITLQQVAFWADAFLGLPVNFSVAYDPTGSAGYTTLTTVTGNAATSWSYTASPAVTCKLLKITVTKINYGFFYASLIEFQGALNIDVSTAVDTASVLTERYPDQATLPIGNASAGELDLRLDNMTMLWNPHSTVSLYAPYLKANRRITYKVGFQYSDGSKELVPFGTFYSREWHAPQGGPTANVKAQDRMKKLRERLYRTCALQVNKTVDACIKQALMDFGLGINEYALEVSARIIPYAWAAPTQSFFDYVVQLAAADGGVVYFDEMDVFHFQSALYLSNNISANVFNFTDSNAQISTEDVWTETEVKNRIVVSVNALKANALAQVWALQETLTVKANSTLTINVTFPNPCTNVQTPVITAGADIVIQSWTAYAMTGTLVLKNNHASNDETVTACTIQAQAIVADGSNTVTAETSDVTNSKETPRELPINKTFIETSAVATPLATNLLALYSDPPPKLNMKSLGLPHLELGDRVNVNSQQMGMNADFYVLRHTLVDDGSLSSDITLVGAPLLAPNRATLWHDTSTVLTGGVITVNLDGRQNYQVAWYQSPGNPGDSFTRSFMLRAGTYIFSVLGIQTSGSPIVSWYVDNVQIAYQDWYNASTVFGVIQTSTVIVPSDGYHILKGVVSGLNPLANFAILYITKMWFKQVND